MDVLKFWKFRCISVPLTVNGNQTVSVRSRTTITVNRTAFYYMDGRPYMDVAYITDFRNFRVLYTVSFGSNKNNDYFRQINTPFEWVNISFWRLGLAKNCIWPAMKFDF